MKILAKVKYLGTSYNGWQKQSDAPSVQENIEKVLSQILDKETVIYGSGRTDSGVHALGQTFHFEVFKDIDLERLRYSANMLLPSDIHIISFKEVEQDFHARFSANGKHYQYRFYVGESDPFLNGRVAFYPYPFDYDLLVEALNLFKGKHNFKDFTSKEEDEDNFVRTISNIKVSKEDNVVYIDLVGDGFMRYMIRDIVGTCLAISNGKEDISFIKNHLDVNDRNIVSYKAKADGLYLIDVIY